MINRAEGDWSRLEDLVRSGTADPRDNQALLDGMAKVRDVLRRMCQVSVTRTSLREAVQEALLPVLKEHREDLFPELAEIRSLLETQRRGAPAADTAPASADVVARLAEFEERVARLTRLETDLSRVDGRVEEVSSRLARLAEDAVQQPAADAPPSDDEAPSERLARLDERLAAMAQRVEGFASELEGSGAKLAESGARLDAVDTRLGELDERAVVGATRDAELAARLDKAESELAAATERLLGADQKSAELGQRVERLAAAASDQVAVFEKQLTDVEKRLGAMDNRMTAADGRVDSVEQNLRSELEGIVQGLANQLQELREMLARVDSTLLENAGPQRQAIQAVQAGLGELEDRLESRFGRMSAQVAQVSERVEAVSEDVGRVSEDVKHIDSLTPELTSLAGRFTEVRQGLEAVAGRVGDNDQDVVRLKATVEERLGDLRRLVGEGIARWEEDQSQTTERLSGIRDTLRDQLHEVSSQFQKTQKSLLGKVMRKEPGLKLSRQEWDQLSGKIEGIVSGLESILTRKRER